MEDPSDMYGDDDNDDDDDDDDVDDDVVAVAVAVAVVVVVVGGAVVFGVVSSLDLGDGNGSIT